MADFNVFRSPEDWVDGSTYVSAASMEPSISNLDSAIGHQGNHCFAMASGPVLQSTTNIWYPDMVVFHHSETGGSVPANAMKIVKNTIAHNTVAQSLAAGYACYVTLADSDGGAITPLTLDIDSLTAVVSLNDRKTLILWARYATATGTPQLHFVGLRSMVPIQGSATMTAGTTSDISFPAGIYVPSADYKIQFVQTGAAFFGLNPRVTIKGHSGAGYPTPPGQSKFRITHDSAAGTETFDWMLVP
jgi:hypothetical protein